MIRIKSLKSKAGFLLAITGAAVVGGATTAFVSAAIPSASGQIHGCYRTGNSPNSPSGALRVIDSEANQTCTAQETALNWPSVTPASASNEAYTFVNRDSTVGIGDPSHYYLDPTRTKNVTNMVYIPSQNDSDGEIAFLAGLCITLPFTPKNIQATPQSPFPDDVRQTVGLKDEAGVWSITAGGISDPAVICQNVPTANAIVASSGPLEHFLKFEN